MPARRASGQPRRRRPALRQRLREVASRQRGVITYWQLSEIGFSPSAIGRLVEEGALRRVHRGIYYVEHPPRRLAAETAALLHLGDSAVLGRVTAAHLWGASETAPRRVQVIAPGVKRRTSQTLELDSASITRAEIRTVEGLRVSSPERTALDVMRCLNLRDQRRTVNELIAVGCTTAPKLLRACDHYRGRPGVARLRRLLNGSERVSGQRSRGELLLSELIARSDYLPPPARNVHLGPWEVDFFWAEAGFFVEFDGGAVHSTPEKFERDRLRDAELQLRGIIGQRVTWQQLRRHAAAALRRLEEGHRLADARRTRRRRS